LEPGGSSKTGFLAFRPLMALGMRRGISVPCTALSLGICGSSRRAGTELLSDAAPVLTVEVSDVALTTRSALGVSFSVELIC
jgi:hypothetical protein